MDYIIMVRDDEGSANRLPCGTSCVPYMLRDLGEVAPYHIEAEATKEQVIPIRVITHRVRRPSHTYALWHPCYAWKIKKAVVLVLEPAFAIWEDHDKVPVRSHLMQCLHPLRVHDIVAVGIEFRL
ncbi:MAG: hypothetical protein JRG73_16380 [Deltaproteobacteria bacterium]|nr:hypothetical protein [Deltaproteobacteria bacterium]